jgi:hypothetical protein
MTQIDVEKERQRLRALYAKMENGELGELSTDSGNLTDLAREVLRAELTKRKLPLPAGSSSSQIESIDGPAPVLLRRYLDLPQAFVAKSILDSAGIESFLADENIVRIDWFYSNLVGGIKLLVREEDAEAARRLLEEKIPETFEAGETGMFQQPRCPRCQSVDISFEGNKAWKCNSCEHAWKEEESSESPAGTGT